LFTFLAPIKNSVLHNSSITDSNSAKAGGSATVSHPVQHRSTSTSRPKNINQEDLHRLLLFSNYAFVYLITILKYYHPYYSHLYELIESFEVWAEDDFQHFMSLLERHRADQQHQKKQQHTDHHDDLHGIHHEHHNWKIEYRVYLLEHLQYEIAELHHTHHKITKAMEDLLKKLLHLSLLQSYDNALKSIHQADGRTNESQQVDQKSPTKGKDKGKSRSHKARGSKVKRLDGVKEQAGEDEDDDDEEEAFKDPLKAIWSELILNPPRALRNLLDTIYEINTIILNSLESQFSSDFIRGHYWLSESTSLLEEMIKQEQRKEALEQSIVQLAQKEYEERFRFEENGSAASASVSLHAYSS
jgi:hypothetical protein